VVLLESINGDYFIFKDEKDMAFEIGLVGLPNAGKSTLFNALTKSSVSAENYPFCTIDPNKAITPVPDKRLQLLCNLYDSKEIIPTTLTFVDIAGIVKGASEGEGLGNMFLSHIRSVDLILYVVRCFEDESIIHIDGTVDPVRDFETATIELSLKDIESLQNREEKIQSRLKKSILQAERDLFEAELSLIKDLLIVLSKGLITDAKIIAQNDVLKHLSLFITKPMVIVANCKDADFSDLGSESHLKKITKYANEMLIPIIPVSAYFEYEFSTLSKEDLSLYEKEFGYSSKLSSIIDACCERLQLISFFTCGKKEIHAWKLQKGRTIREAAGCIHSDLERGFISATIMSAKELIDAGSEANLKEKGKHRTVGAGYIVEDGDVINVLFNV